MLCLWYDCSLKITSTIVRVCHTHVSIFCTVSGKPAQAYMSVFRVFWVKKVSFHIAWVHWKTSVKTTGSSKTIMKGIILFQASCGISETDKFPTHRIPMHCLSRRKKRSHLTEQSHKFCYIQHLWHKKIQCNWCIINPLTAWNCKIICKQETDA